MPTRCNFFICEQLGLPSLQSNSKIAFLTLDEGDAALVSNSKLQEVALAPFARYPTSTVERKVSSNFLQFHYTSEKFSFQKFFGLYLRLFEIIVLSRKKSLWKHTVVCSRT